MVYVFIYWGQFHILQFFFINLCSVLIYFFLQINFKIIFKFFSMLITTSSKQQQKKQLEPLLKLCWIYELI